MKEDKRREVMDSLTEHQRKVIADIIENKRPEGDWIGCDSDGGSIWGLSVHETLYQLAYYFRNYDPELVLD